MATSFIWPAELPQYMSSDYSSTPQSPTIQTSMDVGPPKTRSRDFIQWEDVSGSFVMTKEQVAVFETFYKDTLSNGSMAFLWNDPVNDIQYEWLFNQSSSPYTKAPYGIDVKISVKLIRKG